MILTIFISLVFLTQMRTNTFIGENILSNEYVCCLSTINHIVDSQPVTVGSCIILHQVVVRSTKVRRMNLFLYLKSVLTYESHT